VNVFALHRERKERPHVNQIASHGRGQPTVVGDVFLDLGGSDFRNQLFAAIQEKAIDGRAEGLDVT